MLTNMDAPDTRQMDQSQIEEASSRVKQSISSKDLRTLKEYFNDLEKNDRSRIINCLVDDQSPFFRACLIGDVGIVKYLLSECCVDIELRGLYILESEKLNDRVTPLWVATFKQNFEIVKLLVEHEADINASSNTNSTPVRCACYLGNFTIVKYLVEHGANIHQTNIYGGTCLVNATGGSVELCEYLINNGASVNAKTNIGESAMLYAITQGRLDLVKLLLGAGASQIVETKIVVHILHIAALEGNQPIFHYIKENTVLKPSRLIDGYELMGATMVDDFDNIDEALLLWRTAMELRFANRDAPLVKDIPDETKKVYRFCRETATIQECESLVASQTDTIYMHALLTRERILGTKHSETIWGIRYRGAVYANHKNLCQRAVDLWKYAYSLQRQSLPASDGDVVSDVDSFSNLFKRMFQKYKSDEINEQVQTEDIVDVFSMLVSHLQEFTEELLVRPLEENTFKDFRSLLVCLLRFIYFYYMSEDHDTEMERFLEEAKRAVSMDATSEKGEQLLHIALGIVSADSECEVSSVDVIRCLTNAGADLNVRDAESNSPLHYCIDGWEGDTGNQSRETLWKSLSWLLIEHGAHPDIRNREGKTPLDFLHNRDSVCRVTYTSLKCLAARVIVDSGVCYRGTLPPNMERFVQLHV